MSFHMNTCSMVVTYVYPSGIPNGVLSPDDSAMREIEEAVQISERSGDEVVVNYARATLGLALVHRQTDAEGDRGQKLLAGPARWPCAGDTICAVDHSSMTLWRARRPVVEIRMTPYISCATVDHLFRQRRLLLHGVAATGVLVEKPLIDRSD
jgi:hypothetical protein